MGDALFAFKYRHDMSQLEPLSETVTAFLQTRIVYSQLVAIIAVPPSMERAFQPVPLLCERISQLTGIHYTPDLIVKRRATRPVKNIEDTQSRSEELRDAFTVPSAELKGRRALLFDDIYQGGETLTAATDALYAQGKVGRVYVVTLTRTRSRR